MDQAKLNYVQTYFMSLSKAGINDCAKAKEKTNLGPVVNNFGVKPLKNDVIPSFLAMFFKMVKPDSGLSKFLFWIRVLITSKGAETTKEAEAPKMEVTKFCVQVAEE